MIQTREELIGHKYLYELQWFINFKNPEEQVASWIERLQEYNNALEIVIIMRMVYKGVLTRKAADTLRKMILREVLRQIAK